MAHVAFDWLYCCIAENCGANLFEKKCKIIFYIWTIVVNLVTNDGIMKKKKTAPPVSKQTDASLFRVNEPYPLYFKTIKVIPSLKDFTYTEFKKIADKVPFTQAEWAALLHISERTLQRYAKNNGSFAAINAERAMQIDSLIKRGKEVFGTVDMFCNWLRSNPPMLEGRLSLDSLTTAQGINMVLIQLGRIEHGILA